MRAVDTIRQPIPACRTVGKRCLSARGLSQPTSATLTPQPKKGTNSALKVSDFIGLILVQPLKKRILTSPGRPDFPISKPLDEGQLLQLLPALISTV